MASVFNNHRSDDSAQSWPVAPNYLDMAALSRTKEVPGNAFLHQKSAFSSTWMIHDRRQTCGSPGAFQRIQGFLALWHKSCLYTIFKAGNRP